MTSQHKLYSIKRRAIALVEAAQLSDVILTIETKPLQPLAMGPTATTQDRTDRGYRPAKAAEILGISRATLWRWARDGRLSAKKIGPRTTIFLESEVRRLLATGSAS